MSTLLIRDHVSSYAAAAGQLVAILEASKKAVAPADRRSIMESLYAMTDLNTMLIFHLNRRRISAAQMTDMRKKIAELTDLQDRARHSEVG